MTITHIHAGFTATSTDGGATFRVADEGGHYAAHIAKVSWGKYKLVGEDTYDWEVPTLLKRLAQREALSRSTV